MLSFSSPYLIYTEDAWVFKKLSLWYKLFGHINIKKQNEALLRSFMSLLCIIETQQLAINKNQSNFTNDI